MIGRKEEYAKLERAYQSGNFEFVVIYGRRRIGKSYLLEYFLESHEGLYFEAVEKDSGNNLALMSSVVSEYLYGKAALQYPSFIEIFRDIAEKAQDHRFVFVIDEISFLSEAVPGMIGLLQHFVDSVFKKTKLMLILSGSSRRFMEEEILADPSPLYGRRTLQIKLQPFSPSESREMFPLWSLHDVAAAHVISGGIPYYEAFLARHTGIEEAIRQEFFQPGSSLFTEARLYLMGEYRAIGSYERVLNQVASGTGEVSEIRDKTGLSDANASQMLVSLCSQDIVARKEKIAGKGISRGWKMADGYFAYFYRFVYPFSSLIEKGMGEAPFKRAIDNLDSFIGKRIESAFRDYVLMNSGLLITELGSIDFPNPKTRTNEELDLVGKADDVILLGECKWKKERMGLSVLKTLEERGRMLFGEDAEKHYFLLSGSGFQDDLLRLASERKDITLITGEELFS